MDIVDHVIAALEHAKTNLSAEAQRLEPAISAKIESLRATASQDVNAAADEAQKLVEELFTAVTTG
jgi:hypothetical protein